MNELLNALRSAAMSPVEDCLDLDKLKDALETVRDLEARLQDQIVNVASEMTGL